MMSAFSNGGRILRDRVGRTQKEFDEFLNSRGLGLVDEKMLEGFSAEEGERAATELLSTLLRVKSFEGTLLHEEVIDFLGDLNYSELRFVERTVSDLLVVFSHVGMPPWVPREKRDDPNYKRYIKSNYFSAFKYMDRIANYFPLIKNSLPQRGDGSQVSVLDILKSLAVPLKFFREKLETKNEESLDYYFVLNELFLGLDKFLFQLDPDMEDIEKKWNGFHVGAFE